MYNPYNQTVNPQQQFGIQQNQFQQMISNGQFGQTMPPNNIIPINNNQNGFIYQPIDNQQSYYGYKYYQEPKVDYYNPWGNSMPQQQYGYNYNNPYQQQMYYYGTPYNQLYQQQYEEYIKQQQYAYSYGYRVLLNMVNDYSNKGWTEEDIDNYLNPKPPEMTQKSIEELTAERNSRYIDYVINCPKPNENNCSIIRNHNNAIRNLEQFHKNYDRHSMYQFMCIDLPEILYGFWLEDIALPNSSRNLSSLYNSSDYNELLKMHRSQNPYMNELLDSSKYDNNLDDNELGIELAFKLARRKADLLEGRVSSQETMRRRELMTQRIIDQIKAKEANKYV